MKFRKKPVVIEAVHFDSADVAEIIKFLGDIPHMHFNEYNEPDEIMIKTSEGTMAASRGDWIIKGIKGEFYPCKPDIFEATYEPVKE